MRVNRSGPFIASTSVDVATGSYHLEIFVGPHPFAPNVLVEFEHGYDEVGNLKRATDNINGVTDLKTNGVRL